MCSGSEAGSYSKLIDFVTLNSRRESNKEEASAARQMHLAQQLVKLMIRLKIVQLPREAAKAPLPLLLFTPYLWFKLSWLTNPVLPDSFPLQS